MSPAPEVKLVLDCHTDLGEGPVWDERTGRLYFVDINEKRIHVYTPEASGDDKHFTIDTPVCAQDSIAVLAQRNRDQGRARGA